MISFSFMYLSFFCPFWSVPWSEKCAVIAPITQNTLNCIPFQILPHFSAPTYSNPLQTCLHSSSLLSFHL